EIVMRNMPAIGARQLESDYVADPQLRVDDTSLTQPAVEQALECFAVRDGAPPHRVFGSHCGYGRGLANSGVDTKESLPCPCDRPARDLTKVSCNASQRTRTSVESKARSGGPRPLSSRALLARI